MCDNVHPVPGAVPLVPSSNGYEPGFKTQLMIKDMTLGVEAGEAAGIEPSMARTALDFYKVASEDPLCKVCCFLVLIFFPVDIMSGSLLNISQFHRSGMDRPYTFSSIKQRRRRRISPFFLLATCFCMCQLSFAGYLQQSPLFMIISYLVGNRLPITRPDH